MLMREEAAGMKISQGVK